MRKKINYLGFCIALLVMTAGAQTNTFPSTGNVGIGTANPGALLEVGASNSQTGGEKINATDRGGFPLPLQISDYTNGLTFGLTGSDTLGRQIRLSRNNNMYFYDIGLDSSNQFFITNQHSTTEGFVIDTSGNVGIGTTTPGAKLDVAGNIKISGSGASLTFADGTIQSTAWTGSLCGGDYAESVKVTGERHQYTPGDVLVISEGDSTDVSKSTQPYSTAVAGIYSTRPGLIGRRQRTAKSDAEVPMAMVGIVPTKVSAENGPIKRGDLLVTSSTEGYAMKGTDHGRMLGAIVGKAMGSLASGTGTIEVLVSLQ